MFSGEIKLSSKFKSVLSEPFFCMFFALLIIVPGFICYIIIYSTPYELAFRIGKFIFIPLAIIYFVLLKPHQKTNAKDEIVGIIAVIALASITTFIVSGHILWVNQLFGVQELIPVEGIVKNKYCSDTGCLNRKIDIQAKDKSEYTISRLSETYWNSIEEGHIYAGNWCVGYFGIMYRMSRESCT